MDMKQKITKILEKAASTTSQAEASTLLEKAKRMMEEHQIGAFELGSDPFATRRGAGDFQKGTVAQLRYDLEAAVAAYLGLHPVVITFQKNPWERIPRAVFEFSGPESAFVTLGVMFPFVWKQVLELVRKKVDELIEHGIWRERERKKIYRKLLEQTVFALRCRLQELAEKDKASLEADSTGRNALVLIGGELDAYVSNRYPDLRPGKVRERTLSKTAKSLSDQVRLDRQVNHSDDPARLLK